MQNSIKMEKKIQRNVWISAIILAPLLMNIAHFFGRGFGMNATSGWIGVLAFSLWIIAFQGLFKLTEQRFPGYAALGFIIAVYAAVAGTNFMVDGIYMEALGIDTVEGKNDFHEKFGIAGIFAFYLPGIFFPLTLIVLGLNLKRAGIISLGAASLFMLAGLGFPVSRIPRIPLLIKIDNLLLLLSHVWVAFEIYRYWRKKE